MKQCLLLLALLPALSNAASGEDCLQIDGGKSDVRFEILQAGTPFTGSFDDIGGEVCVDGENVTRVDAWMKPASVVTGLPELDAALAGTEFFNIAAFPQARFVSDSVSGSNGSFSARGTLTLKGTSREHVIPFRLSREDNRYRARGNMKIERLAFDIGTGEWSDTQWLGNDVSVHFDVQTRQGTTGEGRPAKKTR